MIKASSVDFQDHRRFVLSAVDYRLIINSVARLTPEFSIHFEGGASGSGSAPRGETASCFEDTDCGATPDHVIQQLEADGITGSELSLLEFDQYLQNQITRFGTVNAYSLSCAFFEASLASHRRYAVPGSDRQPAYCLNILNGGLHAYTNPVLSDFHEFLLVPRHGELARLLDDHRKIQDCVRQHLAVLPTTRVNGNAVHVLGKKGNRDGIALLANVLDELELTRDYGLMIDAAASALWNGSGYGLQVAERRVYGRGEFLDYWLTIQEEFALDIIEDPFAETDLDNWKTLVASSSGCGIFGDDIHSGDPERVGRLIASDCLTGIVLKPDQAGTISRTMEAIHTAQQQDVPVILSHRSISTDSLVLAHLLVESGVSLAKFGPLYTDYTAILKMNEVLRTTQPSGRFAAGKHRVDHARK